MLEPWLSADVAYNTAPTPNPGMDTVLPALWPVCAFRVPLVSPMFCSFCPNSCQLSWHGTSRPVQLVLLPCSPSLAQVLGVVPQDLLTAWPCPAHHLQVILGVPVGVEDDAGVGSCEVDAQPTCPCAQEKHKAIRVGLAEAVDGSLAQVATHAPVDALIGVPAQQGERLEQNYSGA